MSVINVTWFENQNWNISIRSEINQNPSAIPIYDHRWLPPAFSALNKNLKIMIPNWYLKLKRTLSKPNIGNKVKPNWAKTQAWTGPKFKPKLEPKVKP